MEPLLFDRIIHLQLYMHHYHRQDVTVNWRPPQRFLHYPLLYRGICEYLREVPDRRHFLQAWRYLKAIKKCYHPDNILQYHRILWTREWLAALENPEDSGDETEVGE